MVNETSTDHQFGTWLATPPPGDEVVISGVSGRFPECNNFQEFSDNLLAKTNMVTDVQRWKVQHPDIPKKGGTIPNLNKFDAGFFGLHFREVQNMDPVIRKVLEVAVEAIIDAGLHPKELTGTKTGVYFGYSAADMQADTLSKITEPHNFGMIGFSKSMVANRISYYLKLKGPSYVLDTACSSSLNALEHAYKAIRTGECEMALVGGAHLTIHPACTLQFYRIGVLSTDASCKVFDKDANGYVRSETVSCIFLQKAKNSKRIYAQVVHSKVNTDGFKSDGMLFPSSLLQGQLLKEVYQECKMPPSKLSYFEVHGTGTKVGDLQEVNAIDKIIGKYRDKPLWIGSVKTNVGHSEPASGMCSILKVVAAMESGFIAPNLHFREVKKGMTGIEEGRLVPVTQLTHLDEPAIVGVSNFGFGGNNCHVVLQRFSKKNKERPEDDIPRLVCVSGRTQDAVSTMLTHLIHKFTPEFVAMVHQVFKTTFHDHLHRGFTICSKNGPLATSVRSCIKSPPPLCIKFGTFEQSYKSIARYFLNFPIFRTSMLRITGTISENNTNFEDLIERQDNSILEAAAVQMGIGDMLKALEITSVGIFEDAFGKLICSYSDGDATLKETLEALKTYRELKIIHSNWSQNHSCKPKNSILLSLSDSDDSLALDPSMFLTILGRLYEQGHNPQLHLLYQPPDYPVDRGTPNISSLIRWNHDRCWYTDEIKNLTTTSEVHYSITLADEENKYIEGHTIDGRNLFPATGYLFLVWKAFSEKQLLSFDRHSVVFENCKFIRATTMPKSGYILFEVHIQEGNGTFEVLQNETIVVTGRIYSPKDIKSYQAILAVPEHETKPLESDEIYKELHLRGYNYKGYFKCLAKCNLDGTFGLIKWLDNWVAFMDNMLQVKVLQMDTRLLYVPVGIKKLVIDPMEHLRIIRDLENGECLVPVVACKASNLIKSGGIEMSGLQASPISKRKPSHQPVLEKYQFVPNYASLDLVQSLRINTQIVLEDSMEDNVKGVEIVDEFTKPGSSSLIPLIYTVLEDIPVVHPDLTISGICEESVGVKTGAVTLSSTSNFLFIVGTKILQRPAHLKQVISALSKNGFVLSREELDCEVNTEGVTILTQHMVNEEKLVLFRRTEQQDATQFIEVSSTDFKWMSVLKENLSKVPVVIYSHNQQSEGLLGLINCIRREPGGSKVRCFFIMDEVPKFDPSSDFCKTQIRKNLAVNVFKNGQWGTYRHLRLEVPRHNLKEHSYISVTSRGDLSSVRWFEGPLSTKDKTQNIVCTYYSALNFRDIMLASGRIPVITERLNQESPEGFEYSGTDLRGNRIMGLVNNGALSTLIALDVDLFWMVPNEWSLEDAATVPVVYSTVIYALLMRTSLWRGASILIHSATGGVGIAALNVALYFGCEIFVTVGTKEKREYLKKKFPQIPDSHVGNSRDCSFEELIKEKTKGRGVDIVLNSLAEEKLKASVRCLARGGRFMEIGKYDLWNDNSLDLLMLQKEASYQGVMLDTLFNETAEVKRKLVERVSEGVEKGYVKPLPRTTFRYNEVETAFRFMSSGKHIGKVLVKIREEREDKKKLFETFPRFHCDPKKSYVILGGLGGFGLELADWLVLRGAKKLVLTSRFGLQAAYQIQRIQRWKSYGASILILTDDASSEQGCRNLVTKANRVGPVDGIFNLAVLLEDSLFEDQTEKKFEVALRPKAFATKWLDQITRELCPGLKLFVVFSSVSCGRGNAGQTNYGMANSIMERVCEKRKEEGFPALAIQWGAVGDVGLVAKMQKDNKDLVIGGTLQQKISSCLEVMDEFLNQDNPVVASMVVAEKRDKSCGSGSAVDAIARVIGIKDLKTVSHHATLAELGMDSIMGTEIIQVLEKDFEIYITSKDIRNLTLSRVFELDKKKDTNENDNSKKVTEGSNTIIQYIPNSELSEELIVELASIAKPEEQSPVIFVLPGIEGVLKLVEPLTKNLKARVLGIQYNYRNPEVSIEETTREILPSIEKHLSPNKPFYLIGYSFGVLVALELASSLESKGYNGRIAAIEGSPHYSTLSVKQYAPADTDEELQTMLLCNILAIFLPMNLIDKNKLRKCHSFEERIDVATSLIPSEVANKQKMEKQAAITLYKRFKAVLNYRFSKNKVQASLKLYKAVFPLVGNMESDYNLSELCSQPVQTMTVEGNHVTILQQSELAEDISRLFELKI